VEEIDDKDYVGYWHCDIVMQPWIYGQILLFEGGTKSSPRRWALPWLELADIMI
jgi:hypothetical protein